MDIIIQSLGFKASDNLEAFVHEKLTKVFALGNVIRANVILFQDSAANPENNYCEIRLEVPGNDHFVKKSGAVFETAISDAADTLQALVRKRKEKGIDRRTSEEEV